MQIDFAVAACYIFALKNKPWLYDGWWSAQNDTVLASSQRNHGKIRASAAKQQDDGRRCETYPNVSLLCGVNLPFNSKKPFVMDQLLKQLQSGGNCQASKTITAIKRDRRRSNPSLKVKVISSNIDWWRSFPTMIFCTILLIEKSMRLPLRKHWP